jgi:F-type H+-transporting ATPase subunit a
MIFELFIGFIQAYVFFMLTLIFTALAQESHDASDHSPAVPSKVAKQLE